MLKDPLIRWPGVFPYEALAVVGVTPESSMRQVLDASFDLMEKGLMTPEMRRAWDELRTVSQRLLVDFFLYQLDLPAEIARARKELEFELALWAETPDLSSCLEVGPADMGDIEQDFCDITMERVEIRFMPEFDEYPPLPEADLVVFDR